MKDYSKAKKIMLIIGIILLIVGIIVLLYGFISFGSLFKDISYTSYEDYSNLGSSGFDSVIYIAIGGFSLVIGFTLIYISQFRRVTHYVATETSPAITTASHAFGKGISSGINKTSVNNGSNSTKEIIKIKCRNCGYLESEDADYCSKCGKKM